MTGRAPSALALLLALTACTSGSTPRAAPTSPSPSTSPTVLPTPSATTDDASPDPEPSYRPLPSNTALKAFEPQSVSFVSTRTGWFLGTSPCGRETCGVLLETRDTGRAFIRRTPPPAHLSGVRFADLNEGWAFGNGTNGRLEESGLWRTHDGGRTWRRVLDRPVESLEVGAGSVWAVVLDESGTSPRLFRGSVRSDDLRFAAPVANRSATLTVGHGTAYVVAQNIAGPIATTLWAVTASGSAQRRRNPCTSDEARALVIAVGGARHLVAICGGEPAGAGNQLKQAYASTDDGRTWRRRPDPSSFGYTGPVDGGGWIAATSTSTFVTGSRMAIDKEVGAGPWRHVLFDEEGTGFDYVGFTDDQHGVALDHSGAWLTADAGDSWRRLRFS